MICSRRLYKGNSYEICLPLVDTGITSVKFYTRGDVIIEKEPVYTGDGMCFELSVEDLAILADGVLRYSCDGLDSNTGYITVTPGSYSGETLDDLLEDAYDSGYTAGQEDCSGGTCEGVYESGYTGGYESGYTDGAESVDCTDYYNSGYTSGRTDGEEAGFDEGYQLGETHQKSLLSSISISVNGYYTREDGYSAITVYIPQTGHTDQEMQDSWDSGYTSGYTDGQSDGFESGLEQGYVSGTTDGFNSGYTSGQTDGYDEGYTSGYTDGINAAGGDYASGYTDGFDHGYESGHTDGYGEGYASGVTDGFEPGYTSGHTDGYDEGFDAGHASGVTDGFGPGYNSGYTDGSQDGYEDGFGEGYTSGSTDGFNNGHTSGVTDGENIQKAKLVATSFTANDTYTRADGWSSVTVNVPAVTAYTDQDLIANLQGDYFVIPSGTTHLRDFAFYNTCFSSITIPNTVIHIGGYAFAENLCLREIVIPDSVSGIGEFGLYYCPALSSVTLGAGIVELNNYCFQMDTALQEIVIPASVSNIGTGVFQGCHSLSSMTFNGIVPPTLASTDGYGASLGDTAYTFPIYVPCAAVEDYKTAFGTAYAPRIQCSGAPTPVTASSISISGPQGNMAPGDTGSTSVTVTPNDATTSLSYSSSDSTVATVDTAGTITAVGAGTCNICVTDSISNLTSCTQVTVTQPQPGTSQITNVYRTDDSNGDFVPTSAVGLCSAEFYSAITEMKIDGVSVTPSMTADFSGDVGIPGRRHHTVEFTLNTAFVPNLSFYGNTYLVNSIVSGSCTGIGNMVYWLCKNLGVDRSFGYSGLSLSPNIVLGESDFGYCQNLKEFTIPTATTTIPASLLYVCSGLTSVTIHSGVTQIKTRAFQQCHGLLSIVLPEALTKIESYAFDYCDSLAEIRLLGTVPPTLGQEDVFGHTSDCPIYVPAVAVQDYKTAWPRYANRIQAIQ